MIVPRTLRPSDEISHYRIIGPLGAGGMGEVYRAHDRSLDRDVALKVLPPERVASEERLRRFTLEAKSASSLNHPHIVHIYEIGEEPVRRAGASGPGTPEPGSSSLHYIAMELVAGRTLAAKIHEEKSDLKSLLGWLAQAAEGVARAHAAGIVHRDLKPGNIMVTPDGYAKVLDFGLAKLMEKPASGPGLSEAATETAPEATSEGVVVGTAGYMAPEQVRGQEVDARADVFAFGCMLYEAATGRRAFAADTKVETLHRILHDTPEPVEARNPAAPIELRRLIRRCLAKDPNQRLDSMRTLALELREIVAEFESPPASDLASGRATNPMATTRNVPMWSWALAALALATAGLLILRARPVERPLECVSVAIPSDLEVRSAGLMPGGDAVIVTGGPKADSGTATAPTRVYVRRLDSFDLKPVPGTEGALWAGPLRDGRSIAFTAPGAPGSTRLVFERVPIDGSSPPVKLSDWSPDWRSGAETWSGDHLHMNAAASYVRVSEPRGIAGPSTPMTSDRPGTSIFEIVDALPRDRGVLVNAYAYLPDGVRVSVGVLDPASGRVKVVEAEGANARYSETGHLLFTRGATLFAVPFDLDRLVERGSAVAVWTGIGGGGVLRDGRFQLARDGSLFYEPAALAPRPSLALLDRSGALRAFPTEAAGTVDVIPVPDLDPDGNRFACSLTNDRGVDRIWIGDVRSRQLRPLGTDADADCYYPVWSPDGRQVAYVRTGGDAQDGLYAHDTESGARRRIMRFASGRTEYRPVQWLRGGRILLEAHDRFPRGLFSIDVSASSADSSALRVVRQTRDDTFSARMTPDEHWISFESNETGRPEIYLAPFRPEGTIGPPTQVTRDGGEAHDWSRDGRTLFVLDRQMRILAYEMHPPSGLSPAEPRPVADVRGLGVTGFHPLPDGRFLVGVRPASAGASTTRNLVRNWAVDLERRMRAATPR